jgi:hypothetical protein
MNESQGSSKKQRDDILARLISQSRAARGLGALDDSGFVLMLSSWRETLERIPTGDLEKSYKAATENEDGKKPFGAVNILRAWKQAQGTGERFNRGAIGVEGCCSRDGLVTVDATGSTKISGDYRGHTYTKACPTHRAFGVPRHPDPDYLPAPAIGHREGIRQAEIFRELNPSHKPQGSTRVGLGGLAAIGDFAKKIMQKVTGQKPLFEDDRPRVGN